VNFLPQMVDSRPFSGAFLITEADEISITL